MSICIHTYMHMRVYVCTQSTRRNFSELQAAPGVPHSMQRRVNTRPQTPQNPRRPPYPWPRPQAPRRAGQAAPAGTDLDGNGPTRPRALHPQSPHPGGSNPQVLTGSLPLPRVTGDPARHSRAARAPGHVLTYSANQIS